MSRREARVRLDELRRRSAEAAAHEAEALERHAPAAERDARATRELADAASGLAAVQLGGFMAGSGSPVASAGGSPSPGSPEGAPTIGTGGGGDGQGFTSGPVFLTSQSGQGRQGGVIRAEEWVGEHCTRTEFEVPNPQNTNALAERDFVKVPGWDCSGAIGQPPGSVVFYDPEAWRALQGVPKLTKTSSGGGGSRSTALGPRAGGGGAGLVNQNPGRGAGSAGGTGTFGASAPPPPSSSLASSQVVTLLSQIAKATGATEAELKKRPAGPSGSRGQRLV